MKKILLLLIVLLQLNVSAQNLVKYIPDNSTGVVKFNPKQINQKYTLDSVKNWLMGADYSLNKQLFNSYFDISNVDLALMFDVEARKYYEGDILNYFQLYDDYKVDAIILKVIDNKLSAFKNYLNSNLEEVFNKKTVSIFKNNANKQFGVYYDDNNIVVFKLKSINTSNYEVNDEGLSFEEKELKQLKRELVLYKEYSKILLKKTNNSLDDHTSEYLTSNKDDILLFSSNLGDIINNKFPYPLSGLNKELIDQRYLIGLNFSEGEVSVNFELYNPKFWNNYNDLLSPIEIDNKMFDFISKESIFIQTSNINSEKSYNLFYNHLLPLISDISIESTTGIYGVGGYTQWMMQFFDSEKLANIFTGHSVTAYLPSTAITKMVEVVSYDENFNEVIKNEEQEVLIPSFTSVTGLNDETIMKSFFDITTNVFEECTLENDVYVFDIKSLIKRFDENLDFAELQMNEKYFFKFYEGYMVTSTSENGVNKFQDNFVFSNNYQELIKEYPYLLSVDINKAFNEFVRYKIFPEMYNEIAKSVLSETETLNFGIKTSTDKMSLRLFLKMKSKTNSLKTIDNMFKILKP